MKTAISLPDETYRRAERLAQERGMTRSELYAKAVADYVARLEHESLSAQIDAVLARAGQDAGEADEVTVTGQAALERVDGDW